MTIPDYHPKTEFRIEKPQGRRGYRIRFKSPDTENKWKTLKLPAIDTANNLFKSGTVDADHTKSKLKEILKQQYAHRDRKKKKAPFMTQNIELVERMWQECYTRRRRRNLKKPHESKRDLLLAAEACGMYPLDTCDLERLEDYLDSTLGDTPKKLRRRITWINSILGWLGRPKLIQDPRRDREKVRYLNEPDFLEMLRHVPNDTDKTLMRIAFYTGLRLGEIFYLQNQHVKDGYLRVEGQMTDEKTSDGSYKESSTKPCSNAFITMFADIFGLQLPYQTVNSFTRTGEIHSMVFVFVNNHIPSLLVLPRCMEYIIHTKLFENFVLFACHFLRRVMIQNTSALSIG